jgi:hypothetical protein
MSTICDYQEELDKIQGLKISHASKVSYWEEYFSGINLHFDDGQAVRLVPVCDSYEKNISVATGHVYVEPLTDATGHVHVEPLTEFYGKTIALATQQFSDQERSAWIEIIFDDRTTMILTPEDEYDTNQNGIDISIEFEDAPVLDEFGHEVKL